MRLKINKNNGIFFVLFFVYKFVLDIVYVASMNPIYGYMGFKFEFNIYKYIISLIYFIIIIFYIPKSIEKVSNMVLQMHFVIMIIPMFTIYAFVNQDSLFMFSIFLCFMMEIFLIKKLPLIKLYKIKNAKQILYFVFIIMTVINYGLLLKTNSIHFDSINFNNVYNIREKINYQFPFLGYTLSWQYTIVNPFLMVFSIYKKKYSFATIVILLQFMHYLITPYKAIVLSIILILGIIFVLRRYNFLKSAVIGISIVVILSDIINRLKISLTPFSLIACRMLFIPALIKFRHYEVFSNILDKLYFSEGFIGKILNIKFPYSVSSGYVVASFYGFIDNQNTGYLASAYDNLGFVGMFVMSLLFVLIMVVIDSLSKSQDKNIIFSLIAFQMFSLNDGDLLTTILTGGLFLTILILFLDNDSFNEKSNAIIKTKIKYRSYAERCFEDYKL